MLVASCTASMGAFGMPVESGVADSPILFRDNFNSGASPANWQTENAIWTFERGKLIGTQQGDSVAAIYVNSKRPFAGNITVEVSCDHIESTAEIAFNSSDEHRLNAYAVTIWSEASPVFASRWAVFAYRNGVVELLIPPDATDVADGTMPSPFPIPTRGRFKVRRLGKTITLYVNGRGVGSVTDSDPLPARGKVGLVVSNSTTTFDNFVVRREKTGDRNRRDGLSS
jgi:hypothetical protein